MMYIFIAVFLAASIVSSVFYTRHLIGHNTKTLYNALDDTQCAIELGVRDYLLGLTQNVAYDDIGESLVCITNVNDKTIRDFDGDGIVTSMDIDDYLKQYADALGYKEINIIDDTGLFIYSNIPEYYGFDMTLDTASNEQAHDFFVNIAENGFYVQELRGTSYNINNRVRYAGIRIDRDCYLCEKGSYLQVGFDASTIQENMNHSIPTTAASHRVGETGKIFICPDDPDDGIYVPVGITGVGTFGSGNIDGFSDADFGFDPAESLPDTMYEGTIYGTESHVMYRNFDGYYVVAVIPTSEAHASRDMTLMVMLGMELIAFFILYILVYFFIIHLIEDGSFAAKEVKGGAGALDDAKKG